MWPFGRKPKEGSGESATKTSASTDSTEKKGSPLKIVGIIVVVLIVLGGAGFGAKKFLLKSKDTTTTTPAVATTKATSAMTPTAASGSTTTPKPVAKSDDPEMASWSGPVVDANGSDTFFIDKAGVRTQVELDGVEMPGYGALCSEMENQARAIVTGTVRVEPVAVEHGINQCTAKVTLSGGRDAAETLAAAGWVVPSDNASPEIKHLAQETEAERKGMHQPQYHKPPWTNSW